MPIETAPAPRPRRPDGSALLFVAPVDDATDECSQLLSHAAGLAERAGLQVDIQPWSLREGGRQFVMLTVRVPFTA